MFALSALRVEHSTLVKQLQGAFVAHHGDSDAVKKFADALEVKSQSQAWQEENYARDSARLKSDMASMR